MIKSPGPGNPSFFILDFFSSTQVFTMMTLSGPIINIDDDEDDHDVIIAVCEKLGIRDHLKCFRDGEEALNYLKFSHEYPAIILCDVNMPKITGFELRKTINANNTLRERTVPFIFYSTAANLVQVREAYNMTVQGFFLKGTTFQEAERTLRVILEYWCLCKHPNSLLAKGRLV
jgi:CheY-like chemotaxis protein